MTKTIVKQYNWNLRDIEMLHIEYSDGSCIAVPTSPEGRDRILAMRDQYPATFEQRLRAAIAESTRDEIAWREDAENRLDLERRRICDEIHQEIERENRSTSEKKPYGVY